MFIKIAKCLQDNIKYLDMLYVFKELIPIKQKIDSMVKVIPKTIKQLRGFLQLTRYSIRFIENYASIVLALTEL